MFTIMYIDNRHHKYYIFGSHHENMINIQLNAIQSMLYYGWLCKFNFPQTTLAFAL